MKFAPVILFVYNRPAHTKKCINALKKNDGWDNTDVYVYCDGSKENSIDERKVNVTRKIVDEITSCKSLTIIKSEKNKGLYNSIFEGVTTVINIHGCAIIVEDDILTVPTFLTFMNEALQKYETEKKVSCISGYVYPLRIKFENAFFIRGADCWGWATWKDRWNDMNSNAFELLTKIQSDKSLEKDFTFNNYYPYVKMLKDRSEGKNQSWAILWYADSFLKNKLCLYPPYSLVKNIGNDGSGTHTFIPSDYFGEAFSNKEKIVLPDEIAEDRKGRRNFEEFFKSMKQEINLLQRIKSYIPDGIKKSVKELFGDNSKLPWKGNYSSWNEARMKSSGYNSALILEKVKDAVLKVKKGEAVYERDSVLFDEIHYSEKILNTFNIIAKQHNSELHVTDFGGSLGSSYFQYRNLIDRNCKLKWNVVEQPHFVECGQEFISDERINFYLNLDEALKNSQNHLLLLASVLQYMEKPYSFIEELMQYNFDCIIIDRTAFIKGGKERITIQYVPEEIYKASYPAWFFDESKFVNAFSNKYLLTDNFMSDVSLPARLGNEKVFWKGFIFNRIDA